ncbi:MAG TPA: hypothetical protein VJX94_08615 [Stellaceae bacterium]|nr:hypothetical protein [Stellaceae bacterium]
MSTCGHLRVLDLALDLVGLALSLQLGALGLSSNSHNNLRTWRAKGTYYYNQTLGFTAGYFNINASWPTGTACVSLATRRKA